VHPTHVNVPIRASHIMTLLPCKSKDETDVLYMDVNGTLVSTHACEHSPDLVIKLKKMYPSTEEIEKAKILVTIGWHSNCCSQ
jgi:hypothetical protein